jgi:hypothetical protein
MSEILTMVLPKLQAVELDSLAVAEPVGYGWRKVLVVQDCFASFS